MTLPIMWGAKMLRHKDINQLSSNRGAIISIPEKKLRSSSQVLNKVIVELRKTGVDIQKISLFEEPLEAIVQINKSKRPKAKSSWSQIIRNSKKKHNFTVSVKLNVFREPNAQNQFLLKYEIL